MNICPICGLEGIPSDRGQCPQCDADLTCFKVLDSIPDELPKKEPGSSRLPGMAAILVGLVVLFSTLAVFLFFQFRQVDYRLQDQKIVLLESLKRIDERLERLAREQPGRQNGAETGEVEAEESDLNTLDYKTEESQPPRAGDEVEMQEPEEARDKIATSEEKMDVLTSRNARFSEAKFWTYYSNGNDTLWALAEKYYGSGRFYPVLMEHNPTLEIFTIKKGDPITILQDGRLARDIYERIVVREGRKLYWCYTVGEGDTPKSIASRFYKKDHEMMKFLDLYKNVPLKAGQKLRVLLE